MFTLGILIYIFLGIISILFGLFCRLLVSSVKVFSWIIGFYIGLCIFIAIIKSSIIMFIPILLVLLGVSIGKNIKKKEEQ